MDKDIYLYVNYFAVIDYLKIRAYSSRCNRNDSLLYYICYRTSILGMM